MKLSKEEIQNYFCKLNPIASKIMLDIDETKVCYEHIWSQLSEEEQTNVINETLIKPEIALRYFDNFSSSSSAQSSISLDEHTEDTKGILGNKSTGKDKPLRTGFLKKSHSYDGRNLSSYFQQKTGLKVIHDDVIGVFRDEHSAPFTFKTKSQMDLCSWVNDKKEYNSGLLNKEQIQHRNSPSQNASQAHLGKHKTGTGTNATSNKTSKISVNSKGIKLPTSIGSNKLDESNNVDKIYGKYERLKGMDDDTYEDIVAAASSSVELTDDNRSNLSKFLSKNSYIFSTSTNINPKQLSEEEEEEDLMNNLSLSRSLPYEEEETKQVYEESKLLLDTDSLRKGFDFLNNW